MSEIIFNPGNNGGGGNPFSLGVNLPAPIVIKNRGNNKTGAATVFRHGSDFVQNDIGQLSNYGRLNIYLPNARYSGYNNLGGFVPNNIYDQINALNPFIYMFVWKRKYAGLGVNGGKFSHRQGRPISNGFWSHPPNIVDSKINTHYSNFGNMGKIGDPYSWADSYGNFLTNDVNTFSINARSEWSLGQTQNIIELQDLNPFRFYCNYSKLTVGEKYFNKDQDFFNAGASFKDFTFSRRRTGANNANMTTAGRPWYEPRQSDFNIYLAFALVIANPENKSQYIVGPMSNPVKQSLVMGINSSSKKVPKSFKYTV